MRKATIVWPAGKEPIITIEGLWSARDLLVVHKHMRQAKRKLQYKAVVEARKEQFDAAGTRQPTDTARAESV